MYRVLKGVMESDDLQDYSLRLTLIYMSRIIRFLQQSK